MGDRISAPGEMHRDGTAFQASINGTKPRPDGRDSSGVSRRYIENSPLFYFDRVQTPLEIVHRAEDKAVEPFLGDQVFVALTAPTWQRRPIREV